MLHLPCIFRKTHWSHERIRRKKLQKSGKRQDCSKTKKCWAICSFQTCPEIENMIDVIVFWFLPKCSRLRSQSLSLDFNQRLGRKRLPKQNSEMASHLADCRTRKLNILRAVTGGVWLLPCRSSRGPVSAETHHPCDTCLHHAQYYHKCDPINIYRPL